MSFNQFWLSDRVQPRPAGDGGDDGDLQLAGAGHRTPLPGLEILPSVRLEPGHLLPCQSQAKSSRLPPA